MLFSGFFTIPRYPLMTDGAWASVVFTLAVFCAFCVFCVLRGLYAFSVLSVPSVSVCVIFVCFCPFVRIFHSYPPFCYYLGGYYFLRGTFYPYL